MDPEGSPKHKNYHILAEICHGMRHLKISKFPGGACPGWWRIPPEHNIRGWLCQVRCVYIFVKIGAPLSVNSWIRQWSPILCCILTGCSMFPCCGPVTGPQLGIIEHHSISGRFTNRLRWHGVRQSDLFLSSMICKFLCKFRGEKSIFRVILKIGNMCQIWTPYAQPSKHKTFV